MIENKIDTSDIPERTPEELQSARRFAERVHKHKCMRCNEEFDCRTPLECQANYKVLPNIVTRGDDGQINILPHCPEKPDWEWIRGYGDRMRALGHIEMKRVAMASANALIQGFTKPE